MLVELGEYFWIRKMIQILLYQIEIVWFWMNFSVILKHSLWYFYFTKLANQESSQKWSIFYIQLRKSKILQKSQFQRLSFCSNLRDFPFVTQLHQNCFKMNMNQPSDKFVTNLESWEPGLQDRLSIELPGATIMAKKRFGIKVCDFYPLIVYIEEFSWS